LRRRPRQARPAAAAAVEVTEFDVISPASAREDQGQRRSAPDRPSQEAKAVVDEAPKPIRRRSEEEGKHQKVLEGVGATAEEAAIPDRPGHPAVNEGTQ
jgi:hypothetical protein